MKRRFRIAGLCCAAPVAASACSPSGLADHTDTTMGDCLIGLGIDITDVDEWSVEQERDVLAEPDVLDCMLDHVPAEQRPDLLERAFPDDPGTLGDQDHLPQVVAVVGYAEARAPETDLATMAELLAAFELTDHFRDNYVRNAVAVHLAPGGPEAFAGSSRSRV